MSLRDKIELDYKTTLKSKDKNKILNAKVSSWEDYSPKRKFDIVIDGGYFYVTEERYLLKAIDKKNLGFVIA